VTSGTRDTVQTTQASISGREPYASRPFLGGWVRFVLVVEWMVAHDGSIYCFTG
jgi:hypothetical protein